MRAVNLIPTEQRGGTSVGGGRSEGAVYALLGVVAVVAILAVLYGKAHRDIGGREAKAASLSAEAQQVQTEATALTPYTTFVALRQQREQAVATLVDSRFDWAHAFHELGRVLTPQTSIASFDGEIGTSAAGAASSASASSTPSATPSTTPSATPSATPGASGAASSAAANVSSSTPPGSVPTFNLSGCATSQRTVAQMLERLRLIDGVSGVTLQSSTRGSTGGGASGGACPAGDPSFVVAVAFDALPSTSAAQAATKPGAKTVSDSGGKAG